MSTGMSASGQVAETYSINVNTDYNFIYDDVERAGIYEVRVVGGELDGDVCAMGPAEGVTWMRAVLTLAGWALGHGAQSDPQLMLKLSAVHHPATQVQQPQQHRLILPRDE